MTGQSYVNLTSGFIEGLRSYLKNKEIPLKQVVEVFAGNGALGLGLGLEWNRNISDSLLFADYGYEDEVNRNWERKPVGVVKETAYETAIRFGAVGDIPPRLFIMGAPPPANSYYCPSYDAAKALHYLFNAKILFIGELSSSAFASPKFFTHVEKAEDDGDETFQRLVVNQYDNNDGYFASNRFRQPLHVRPYLLKFVPCGEENCDCLDSSQINKDVDRYKIKQL
ncbi:hypothetical protein [Sediminibacillus massiliensis]|uniref:hypothetical protein n=1 Tax=Sediminibacillus massiliensis TaxID=1926277 RepID=UPI00098874BB|nr:hypothetical protein [Sediminibacillus massiliensis]